MIYIFRPMNGVQYMQVNIKKWLMIHSVTTRYENWDGQKEESVRFVNPDALSDGDLMKQSLTNNAMNIKNVKKLQWSYWYNFFRVPQPFKLWILCPKISPTHTFGSKTEFIGNQLKPISNGNPDSSGLTVTGHADGLCGTIIKGWGVIFFIKGVFTP